MKCPKCNFEINEAGAVNCPRCGAVLAKFPKAEEEDKALKRRISVEESISADIERQMEADEEIRSRLNFDPDPEYFRDESAYPVARFLSGFFAFLAAFTAITETMGLVYFYQWGKLALSPRELLLFMIALVVASAGSVVVLLAISEGLKMGRDVANHARAMREYLRGIAGNK